MDDNEGDASAGYGVGYGTSRDAAAKEALKECKSANQGGSCKVVVKYDQWGAYAANKTHFGVGWGKSEAEAEARRKALSECGASSCKIVVADCE